MARTKRKVNPIAAEAPAPAAKEAKRYMTAGYARLSVEDSGKPGSETLESQKRLIMDYIEGAPDMEFTTLFFDNGETGTDFKRPGFESLMDAVCFALLTLFCFINCKSISGVISGLSSSKTLSLSSASSVFRT